ncbi:MAG: right-handed parallel beta-helix repeat-containing protein, partial [Patescibacteria group bacterium]|nr:right-handed parallel beta-helix repeat-containing protein [Patescibacteria group bacterium]
YARVSHGSDSMSAFYYAPGNLKRWTNLEDVETVIFNSWDEARLRISDLDEQTNKVLFTGPARYKFDYWAHYYNGKCARYIVENVFEALDSPGEWYLNKHTGELYYYPKPGVRIEDAVVVAPVLNQLMLLQGDTLNQKPVQYIRFSGLTFCVSDYQLSPKGYPANWGDLVDPTAITFSYAENCALKNCSVTNVGTYAVELAEGSAYNVIDKCEISYTGSGGIRIENLPVKRNIISNNHVHHCGIIYPSGVGICMNKSGQNIISHNHVHDIGYCGLTVRGPENIVEYNHVHHVMQRLCDGAGIYLFDDKSDGTIIRNNVFHDVYPYAFFGWGIYLDERTEHVTVMNNIVYRTLSGGTMIHGGKYNFWENNIFVDSGEYQIFWNTLRNTSYKNIYEKNIFYYTNPKSKLIYVPGTWTFNAIEYSDYNLFFCKGGNEMLVQGIREVPTFEQWQRKGFDFHSVVADPLFVDPEHDNYTLKENSPAFKLGFQQIDISTVGPQE